MDRIRTAVHEAGHAVVGYVTNGENDLLSVSIVPDDDSFGRLKRTGWGGDFDLYSNDDEESQNKLQMDILISLAGSVAEKIEFGEHPDEGAESDIAHAVDVAAALVSGPQELESLINESMNKAEIILREHWPAVKAVADQLLERNSMDSEEIRKAISQNLKKEGEK